MKKQILTTVTTTILAIATSLAIAAPIVPPGKLNFGTDFTVSETAPATKVVELTELDFDQKPQSIDYQATYPYVLMSYFAEMYKVSSSKSAKQDALRQRVEILEKAGFSMVTDSDFVPEGIKSFFVAQNAPKKIAKKSGLIGGFYDATSQLKARLFINPAQKKLVIAIAGTNFGSTTSMLSAYSLGSGKISKAAIAARKIAIEMQKSYPDFSIELTGASQGGAIAQYAAVTKEIKGKAIVFNSLAIHSSITSLWSEEQSERISHAYLDGELLNGNSYSSLAAQNTLQNEMPVSGFAVPVDPILEAYIADAYYKSSSTAEKARYYFTPKAVMLHWTGSLLEAVEYHAEYQHLPSLY